MFITKTELNKRLSSNTNLINILHPEEKLQEKIQAEKDIDKVLDGIVLNQHGGEEREIGHKGRVKGDENIPQMFREIVAAQAQFDSTKNLQRAWGISRSEVNNLRQGIPNRSNIESPINKGVQDAIQAVTGKIREKVADRILMAIDSITDDKMVDESAKTLSSVAANLSRVLQGIDGSKDKDKLIDNRIQTIIYAPETNNVENYQQLQVAR